jgi:hypothetical protein
MRMPADGDGGVAGAGGKAPLKREELDRPFA